MSAEFKWTPEAIEAANRGILGGYRTRQVLNAAVEAQPVVDAPTRCPRDSGWCDGVICRKHGIECPRATPVVGLPRCPSCGGAGHRPRREDLHLAQPISYACPACNSSGVDRLVPVSEIRAWIEDVEQGGCVPTVDVFDEWLDERERR
ncbi:MAG: hypothetical protein Q8O56_06280 [Solirubrobacteraceae bacterium]|nr:hypothetical protein [Solirubrobacteraceae bacterium]